MGEQQSNTIGDFFRNQFTTESGREHRAAKKAAKNKLRDAEANQTNALAQALMSPDGGMSTGAIIGIALGGVLLLGGITLLIIKSKKK